MAATTRSDRWCFTVNNYGEWRPPADVVNIRGVEEPAYMVWEYQIAPTTGTPHIQGYVRFSTKRVMSVVKTFLRAPSAHLAAARGSESQNRDYCTSMETRAPNTEPVEIGEFSANAGSQGHRSDLDTIAQEIVDGKTLKQVALDHSADFIRYHAGIESFFGVVATRPAPQRVVTVYFLWGPTGVGKTHRVRTQWPDVYSVEPGRDPWGGYSDQTHILFDEFDESSWAIQTMNRLLDKWSMDLDRRYHNRFAAWTHVAMCCNQPPEGLYSNALFALRQAFLRRLTHVYEVVSIEQEINLT